MKFEKKLKTLPAHKVWEEYCGFLDFSLGEYMEVQYRLLAEQIYLFANCKLGERLFAQGVPGDVTEFRRLVPLTTYHDYVDVLLPRREDMLPGEPVIWLSTTWEGGDHPFKAAPYTQAMLDVYRNNILGAMLLSTSGGRGHYRVRPSARVLYSLAPLPYATGLFPNLVAPEIRIKFLPPLDQAQQLSFSARCKEGFKLSLQRGMHQFYGMTSIIYNMSKNFPLSNSGAKFSLWDLFRCTPAMLWRISRARYRSRRDNAPVRPKDIFRLDGLVCVGTDTALYKNELEQMWGLRPLEVAGGTETCLLGTETWNKDGLVFYPDNCFYEFIPEQEMLLNLKDPSYLPQTYLMDELAAGEKYELVITSLKGGAFARYRVGDVYRCLRTKSSRGDVALPQFEYVDRVPNIIDIDGFTRITRQEIDHVLKLSHLPVADWFAFKEYKEDHRSFLHLYVEISAASQETVAVSGDVLREHLNIYFRHYDSDYADLSRLLGVDPLQVTVVKPGSIAEFEALAGAMPRMNPNPQQVVDFQRFYNGAGVGRCWPHD